MAMQSSSSSSFLYGFTYQVFVSFRGSDTRYGFTGNLYKALTDQGIHTFIDDIDLQRGDEITPSLIKAIEESRIFIPVFSINYASSSFCLDELVHIIHCYKTKARLVLPVFYGVDPTHVRHQNGSYGQNLTKHEGRFQNNKKNMDRLNQWKMALNQAANLSGYHFGPGYEYKFIAEIVKCISNKINRVPLHVAEYPVGLQSRVQQVKSLLDKGTKHGVDMVGLYGTGGLGKSTLAKAIYNFIADQFEGLCFLHNVREKSHKNNLKHLQEELLLKTIGLNIMLGDVSEGISIIRERLCRKKILLILDDVDELKQLQAIIGEPHWLGHGSKVIVTTRDKHLLSCHGIERIYEVNVLNKEEALELFRWMAFKNNKIESSYYDILNRAIKYTSGLPLALEVVGSNLFGKCIAEWESTLAKYERIPHGEVQKILKVSFDSLDEEEQSVFLDIACCFKWCGLDEVENILRAHYGHSIKCHVRVLVDKSLIKIRENNVRLHDLVEDMGKEIVRQESLKEPGERTRLWYDKDILDVLKENTGTSKIEMIYLNSPSIDGVIDWNGKAFKKMKNLKTLIIKSGHFSKGSEYFPSSLRVLEWQRYLSDRIPSSLLNKKFENMKILKFDNCEYLTEISDVSCLSNLENISFNNCKNLITIHNSIGFLNKLETLSAEGCVRLTSFPPLDLTSLRSLNFSYCKSLQSFPDILGKMKNIEKIEIYGTLIDGFPVSFQNLTGLTSIYIRGRGIFTLTSIFIIMPKLSIISVEGYRVLAKQNGKMSSTSSSNVEQLYLKGNILSYECLSIILTWFSNVRCLELSHSNFKALPSCLKECRSLWSLQLDGCKSLEDIGGIHPELKRCSALWCRSLNPSSRNILLNHKMHEISGNTNFCFPSPRSDSIPEWFEHESRGLTISFWFTNKIPFVALLFSTKWIPNNKGLSFEDLDVVVNVMINGKIFTLYLQPYDDHTYLLEMNLKEMTMRSMTLLGSEPDEASIKNKWIHVEVKLKNFGDEEGREEDLKNSLRTIMGIHVYKEKNNIEDIKFTDPYRKRKPDEDLNASVSRLCPLLKKQRLEDMEVHETELVEPIISLLARLQTISFVPFVFSFCLLVFSFVVMFWRIPFLFFFP